MQVRLSHPEHGVTHAFCASELAQLRSRGWAVAPAVDAPAALDFPSAAEVAARLIAMLPAEKRKPGRPAKGR